MFLTNESNLLSAEWLREKETADVQDCFWGCFDCYIKPRFGKVTISFSRVAEVHQFSYCGHCKDNLAFQILINFTRRSF